MPRGRPKGKPKGRPKGRAKPAPHKTEPTFKKRIPAVEILDSEELEQERPQVVEVKHKTEWSEMRPLEQAPEDEEDIFEDEETEETEETEGKPRSKRRVTFDAIRNKLAKAGITPTSQLKLSIEKYRHSELVDGQGGHFAEREHCAKYVCSEEHVKSEDYLDVARRFGAGLFRFTLRMQNRVITAWDKRIVLPVQAIIQQQANPADPTSPQISVPDVAAAATPISVIDPVDQLVKSAAAYQKLRKAFEPEAQPPAQPAQMDSKIAALQLVAENPEVMEKIGKGIASLALGKGATDGDPWAEVAMEAVKSGQAAQIVKTAIDAVFTGINNLFPPKTPPPAPRPPLQPRIDMAPQAQPITQNAQNAQNGRQAPLVPAPGAPDPARQPVQVAPVDALVYTLIDSMSHRAPISEARNIINISVVRNPELEDSIDELLSHPVDDLFTMLKAWRPEIERIEHAKPWLESLIASYTNEVHEEANA